jgi:transcription-repair coupling factor (superfamily II helicase)
LTVPAFVMDRPVLHTLAQELAASERFQAFLEALRETHEGLAVEAADRRGPRARVSEPALPLVLAALHTELERGLVVLLPEDADARDAAEAAAWFLGPEHVALLPSRGVRWESGLDPAPHLVGERARALDVLAAGGLVAASAAAVAEGMPPPGDRPEPIRLPQDADDLTERLALAGYERVERAEERGQFAVRGGIVDVFPTTGREPLRIELFGDEIESIRAFSPFTQRTLHSVDEAVIYAANERRSDLLEPMLLDEDEPIPVPDDLVPPLGSAPDLVWQPDAVRELWAEEELEPQPLEGAAELDPFPSGQPFSFEAQRPAIAARGLAEAENELGALVRAGLRVVVAFAHQGEALRSQNLLRRVDARLYEPGDEFPR